jgi:hypothetical protein
VKKNIFAFSIIFVSCCLFFAAKTQAAAQPQQSSPGITLSPAVVQAQIQNDESEHRLTFTISNNQPTARTIKISTADFNTLDESGGLVFVGTNPTTLQKKYGLATWLTLPQTSITLQPKQTTTINASVVNQSTLSPGGHYGALMLGLEDSGQDSSNNKVSVHPIATSLLFIDKIGGDTHRLALTDTYIEHNILRLPASLSLRFYNGGNTHLIPRGEVLIENSKGKLLSKGIINEDSAIILPETHRRYSVPLRNISSALIPGKYKIIVNYRFDGYDQFRTYQTSQFLFTGASLLAALGVVMTLVIAALMVKNRSFRSQILRLRKILH